MTTTAPPAPVSVHPITRTLRMMRFELTMIVRQRVTLLTMVFAPAFVMIFPILAQPETSEQWAQIAAPMCILALLFSVYVTSASVVTARRETQLFKRLRTSELAPAQMLSAIAGPLILIGTVQGLIVLGGCLALGAPFPQQPGYVVLALLGTAVLAVAAGVATGSVAPNIERVQWTVMPLIILGAVGANLVLQPLDEMQGRLVSAIPFASLTSLLARGMGASEDMIAQGALTALPPLVSALLITALWTWIAVSVARKRWRWEPRS
ncbi:ABC transporter permease [Hoyosella subflava]|uniref:ABC-2 type transporter n=1 Tax=Hoyosella subflava (strain DSM 45089 / JCM 17490 / NBRC 109087 / DQS3-9A1) TaxID=443218 RepID=F6ERK2_HOYSD|nr:ABC transporter permease [Hoyosella subflava]AEF38522.1 ABC-2 type transporter [Hoyosella subflava DQS3-9A1]